MHHARAAILAFTTLAVGLALAACHTATTPPPPSPDYAMTLSPATLDAGLADSAGTTLQLTSKHGFSGTLTLDLLDGHGHPAPDVSVSPKAATLAAGKSATVPLTIAADASLPAGSFAFTLEATGGGATQARPVTLTLSGTANGTFPTSTPPTTYSTGTSPYAVAVGDFNGDGHPDLAVANFGDNDVSILINDGRGAFPTTTPPTYPCGTQPFALAVGDFNGDGNLDLAVVNRGDNTVSVLLGNGDGTFPTTTPPAYPTGSFPMGVAVGDFNGDGHPDLAVTNANSSDVAVLLNNGDGTFPTTTPPTYPTGAGSDSVAVGDFNGDGHPDLAVANLNSNDVSVLLNNGNGTFPASAAPTYPTGNVPWSVAVGDFNGDGHPDLAITNGSGVAVLLNNGNGTFPTTTPPTYPTGTGPDSVAVGDFNGDGHPDLAVANQTGNDVSILINDGHGAFPTSNVPAYPAGQGAFSVAVGDFNADGKLDLAVANQAANTVSVLLANGNGTFPTATPPTYPTGSGPWSVVVADFNADGRLDLATADIGGYDATVLLGN